MKRVKQAVILAGGLGTRLRPLTNEIPKPMAPANNRPFLEYLLEMLKESGIEDIVLLLGYLPDKITNHFGDGKKFGLNIKYSITDVADNTGTRIKKAEQLLDDVFLLMYCDNYWPLNLQKLADFYNDKNLFASVTVYSNKAGITKNNILVDDNGYVVKYDKSRTEEGLNGVEIGFFIIDKKVVDLMPNYDFSFEEEFLPKLISQKQLAGYLTDHRYYSITTLEKLKIAEEFLRPRKVIFLDRDGVINEKPPKADYVKNWSEFKFLPGAIEAVKTLNQNGFETYVVTNQPGIARGMMTENDLEQINSNLREELEKNNARIDGIYCCLHGWDEGCDCRKPKPGLFFRAANEHYIDLTKTIFIGDEERDLGAGHAAGCKTILVTPENGILQIIDSIIKNQT